MSAHTDTPAELAENQDGAADDGALDQQIIGCLCRGPAPVGKVSGLGSLAVGGTRSKAEPGDLTVAGIPGYLFTQKSLSNPVLRRRLGAAIKRLTPKVRRRVIARLKAAAASARVSGAIRSVTPSIAGYGAGVGWHATSVSVGRCPLSSVAGALTP